MTATTSQGAAANLSWPAPERVRAVAVVTAIPAISKAPRGPPVRHGVQRLHLASPSPSWSAASSRTRAGGAVPRRRGGLRRRARGGGAGPDHGDRPARPGAAGGAPARASVAYVGIGRAWSTEDQPRLFGALSTAWSPAWSPVAAGWITSRWAGAGSSSGCRPRPSPAPAMTAQPLRPCRPTGGRWPLAARLARQRPRPPGSSPSIPRAPLPPAGPRHRPPPPAPEDARRPGSAAIAARLCVNIAFFGCSRSSRSPPRDPRASTLVARRSSRRFVV